MNIDQNDLNTDYLEEAPTSQQLSEMRGNVIVEFGVPECPHCQLTEPLLQEVLSTHPELTHIKIYDGKGKPLGRRFKVKLWPTLIFLQDGQEIDRLVRPSTVDQIYQLVMQFK